MFVSHIRLLGNMIHNTLNCPKLKRQLAEPADLLGRRMPWQLLDLHSLSLLPCPKIL